MNALRSRVHVLWIAGLLLGFGGSAARADDKAFFLSGGQFGTVDLTTGAATVLGTSVNAFLAGLAQVGGTLYTAIYNAGGTLYTVNPSSGALNPVGNSSIIFFALGSTTTGIYAAGWPLGTDTRSQPPFIFTRLTRERPPPHRSAGLV